MANKLEINGTIYYSEAEMEKRLIAQKRSIMQHLNQAMARAGLVEEEKGVVNGKPEAQNPAT
jgi:hypothetical protein